MGVTRGVVCFKKGKAAGSLHRVWIDFTACLGRIGTALGCEFRMKVGRQDEA
jgi:hypothetical protein